MTANKWYCIAQTTTFDTGCGINVAFEDSSILFTANVRYGTSSINISSCSIQDEYEVSVRLRETSTMWCVDLLCNKDIEPQIDVTDSPYWSSSNVAAGTGTILTVINNISKAFNTNKGTGEGESYWDRINVGTEENPIYSVVPKNYNDQVVHIVSYGEVSSGGFSQSEEGEGGGSIVIVEQIVTSTDGTPVANILINGEDNFIYAPNTTKALDAHIEDYNTYKTLTDETLRRHDERLVALEELNNLGLSLVEQDGKTWLRSEYDFFSEGEVSSGGASDTEGEGGSGGSVVTVEQIVTDANGVPIAKINVDGVPNIIYAPRTAEVDLTGYATTDYVNTAIQNAKDTRVDTLINTTIPALESDLTALRNDFDALNTLLNDDVSEKIDTWNEVVDFLDEYSGSQDLATILSVMNADIAKRALQTSLDTTNANLNSHIDTFNTFVDATNNTLSSHNDRIKTFEDIIGIDKNGDVYIKKKADDTARNFYSYGEVSSGGLSDTGGSTGGGSNVSYTQNYTGGLLLGTLSIDGVTDGNGIYAPNNLSAYNNDVGFLTSVSWDAIMGKPTTLFDWQGYLWNSNTSAYDLYQNGVYSYAGGVTGNNWPSEYGVLANLGSGDNANKMQFFETSWGVLLHRVKFDSDSCDWRVILDSANCGNYALPITGGTISGNLTIYRSDSAEGAASIIYTNRERQLGKIGIGGMYSDFPYAPFWLDKDDNTYALIHSGNIGSQRVANANTLGDRTAGQFVYNIEQEDFDAADVTGVYVGMSTKAGLSSQYRHIISLNWEHGVSTISGGKNPVWQAQLSLPTSSGYNANANERCMAYRTFTSSGANNWIKLIDANNIDSYNAGSATKLANARSIWGQPFDGESDISGNLTNVWGITMASALTVTQGSDAYMASIQMWGNALRIQPRIEGTGYNVPTIINANGGSVLIGTTSDNGAKLQVNGNASMGLAMFRGVANDKDYCYVGTPSENNDMYLIHYYGNNIRFFTSSDEKMRITGGGNVLIGTETDYGSKLYVKSTIASQGVIAAFDSSYSNYGYNYTNMAIMFNGAVKGTWGWNDVPYSLGTQYNAGIFLLNDISGSGINIYDTGEILVRTSFMRTLGNFVADGEVTSGSDERCKQILSHADIDIETIANAPIINFKWTDREDDKVHLGSTAQYWYGTSLCNGVIPTDDEKLWTMGYGQIALASVVSVAKKVVNHEERLQIVEKELADYKAENQMLKQLLNQYRYGIQ